jgi:m7GpppX diphosphatase
MARTEESSLQSFAQFRVEKLLSCPASRKFAAVVGSFQVDGESVDGTKAVVTLERKPFDPDRVADLLLKSTLTLDFSNAEYSVYNLATAEEHCGIKCDVIHPATAKHIAKYQEPDLRVLRETPAIYKDVTLPYIEADERGDRIQWVYNILEKKKESERIIFEDPDPANGFILLPDMKWDQSTLTNLYCLAIVNRRDIVSLRCLTSEHLPLLNNILDKVIHPASAMCLSSMPTCMRPG